MKVENLPNQWTIKKQPLLIRVFGSIFVENPRQRDLSDRVDIALKEEGFEDPENTPELL